MATPDQDKESNTSEKESFADEALDLAAQQCQRPKMMANARSEIKYLLSTFQHCDHQTQISYFTVN